MTTRTRMRRPAMSKLNTGRIHLTIICTALATILSSACAQQQKTSPKVGASATTPPAGGYDPYRSADAAADAERRRIEAEAAARNAKQCTLSNCDKVRFSYTIAQGENSDEKGSLWGYTGRSVTWSLTPAPNIDIGNRQFKFKVKGAPSDARITSDTSEIRIIFNADNAETESLEIIARDMDYCEIEKENNTSIDCNDLDTPRDRDDVDQISYQIFDERDIPETAQEKADRLEREREKRAERAAQGNAIGCIAERGADALKIDSQIGDLLGTVAGVIAGGSGRGCSSSSTYPY
jgi:hypothetical protein